MYSHQKYASTSATDQYIDKTNFGWQPFLAGILKFLMAASTKSFNVSVAVLIMFIDAYNMGIDTKM